MPRSDPCSEYNDSVFINCPFDREYTGLFNALLFTVHDCGYIARCALEFEDASQVRVDGIFRLIRDCRYGIHDLSRTELDPKHKLPRFNMPLELGMFLGAKKFGERAQRRKRCLILDREPYRFQKFCSDIGGQDPRAHKRKPETAVRVVRNFLRAQRPGITTPGADVIYRRYRAFCADLPGLCHEAGLQEYDLTFPDFVTLVIAWIKAHAPV